MERSSICCFIAQVAERVRSVQAKVRIHKQLLGSQCEQQRETQTLGHPLLPLPDH